MITLAARECGQNSESSGVLRSSNGDFGAVAPAEVSCDNALVLCAVRDFGAVLQARGFLLRSRGTYLGAGIECIRSKVRIGPQPETLFCLFFLSLLEFELETVL
ncbi:hypothetical protein AcV7_007383 [Taiwanofungus camphoratus]|nr:hypothetical protein AcV7_007383 [Antrodia cinnamomea]